MFEDTLNPRFVFHSFLRAGDDVTLHIDRAIERWQGAIDASVDRHLRIEFLHPIQGAQTVRVDLWVEDLDTSVCVYGFLLSTPDGNAAFARGDRTLIGSSRWSAELFERAASLRKDLPAYA